MCGLISDLLTFLRLAFPTFSFPTFRPSYSWPSHLLISGAAPHSLPPPLKASYFLGLHRIPSFHYAALHFFPTSTTPLLLAFAPPTAPGAPMAPQGGKAVRVATICLENRLLHFRRSLKCKSWLLDFLDQFLVLTTSPSRAESISELV